ncbi:MAG: hypothetical protein CME06_18105 [Gemmatimonadetes bacterium]|nr:hypothetical protein [Gemmatimonadota bacterium]
MEGRRESGHELRESVDAAARHGDGDSILRGGGEQGDRATNCVTQRDFGDRMAFGGAVNAEEGWREL